MAMVLVAGVSTVVLSVWLTQAYGVDRIQPMPLMVSDAPAAAEMATPEAAEATIMGQVPMKRVVPARVDQPVETPAEVEAVAPVEAPIAPRVVVREDRPMFDGRPIRPARRMTMLVTAYSPDERSCGIHADGITASGYSVWTNGMKLVAADTRLLPFGSIVTIPGYHGGKPVPVLDRGGKIKGHRLDVLYPTHEIARQWGAQRLEVTVWEYAD